MTSLYELLLLEDSNAASSEELSLALVSHIENGLAYMRAVKSLNGLIQTISP